MEIDLAFFAYAVPAVLFAGVSKGGFAGGAAFAATPLLALILGPGEAIGLMLPLLMLMDVAALRPYWKKWDTRSALAMISGTIPGILVAALVYRYTDPDLFRLLIGLMALAFVGWQGVRRLGLYRPEAHHLSLLAGRVAGFVAGFTSFVSHAGGPPAAVFLLSRGLDKITYQATSVIVFWAINAAKAVPYALLGIFTARTLLADLLLAPVALLGVWLGVRAHRIVPERAFFALTYALLLATGGKLVWDALA
ncbi:MAG: sulfite exporter TauE/SafE family protein [Alphaproteobacteria bacterium]|nr:MAG: sulfite exporter TauE/SafE family protein [Alphaproteobacteria bacterium]